MSKPQWWAPFFVTPIFNIGNLSITLGWLITVLLLLMIVSLLTTALKSLLKNRILLSLGLEEGNREAIATLSSFAFGTLGYIVVLQMMGLNLASLAVLVGGLGVGIGFGLQEITKNLISGLTLLIERKIKVGDLIKLDQTIGYIKEISIRSTTIRTITGSELILPNTILTSNSVENWHYANAQSRLTLSVGVAYGTDPLLVTEILLQSAYMEPEVLLEPFPKVIFIGFGDSSLDFELWVWINRPENFMLIKSSLYFILEYNLRTRGVSIPFPQRELWINHSKKSDGVNGEVKAQPPSLKEMLREICYFQEFNDLQLRLLIEMGCRKHLHDGDILFRQGEQANSFCIVLQGRIDAIHETGKVSRQIFTFTRGQYFGELPLILEVPYPTTMKATGETLLFMLNSQGFRQLIATYPELSENIAQELAHRSEEIKGYQQQLKEMGLWDEENMKNPVAWIRERWKKLFKVQL